MEFVILGRTALIKNGVPVQLGAAKERGLLSLLLLYAGEPVKVDLLVECLWHGRSRSDRRQIIYSLISRLRATFLQQDMPDAVELVRTANAYRLHVNPLAVDLHSFRSRVRRARQEIAAARYDIAVTTLQEAIELWCGEPIPDAQGAGAAALRGKLEDELLTARKLLAEALLRTGRHQTALAGLENLVHDHDLDETIARLWITALHAVGRSDDARRHLTAFRPRFRRATQAEPDIDLVAIMSGTTMSPAPGVRPHQLPNGVKDFTGRADILRELDGLTELAGCPGNAIVLTGMPGVGKTAVALHWSQHHRDLFPDGQLYLDAGTHGPGKPVDPHAALARFLDALGVPAAMIPPAPDQRRDMFNRLLDGRRMLVILDDVHTSAQAQPLIPVAPGCLTLVTSRHSLGRLTVQLAAPTVTIRPLTTEESITMLTRLIGSRHIEREPDALTRLAKAADGLPLALRIIGQHVLDRPRAGIAELADELRRHLLDPVDDDDQVSLHTVFSWSYRTLPTEVAQLFRRMAQHPGASISVEVAAAMTHVEPQVAQKRLNALAKAHLIDHDTARHYRFHDLLRIYAEECAADVDGAATIAATRILILEWYLFSAANATSVLFPESPPVHDLPEPGDRPAMRFTGEADALRWCERERDNLTAATRCAARFGLHRHAWQIQGTVHQIIYRSGRLDGLLELNEIAVTAARRDGHSAAEIGHLLNVGAVHMAERRHWLAETAATAALQLARDTHQADYQAICSYSLATALLETGRTDEAVRLYDRVLDLCRRTSNGVGEAATLHRLGDVHHRQGAADLAAKSYLQALELLQRMGSAGGQGRIHTRLAALYLATTMIGSAIHHCEQALATYEHTRDEKTRCEAITIRADIRRRSAAPSAVVDAREAVAIATQTGDPAARAAALTVLTEALVDAGSYSEAGATAVQCLQLLDTVRGYDIPALRSRLLTSYATALRESDG